MRRLLAALALVAVAGCGGGADRLATGEESASPDATPTGGAASIGSGEPTPSPGSAVSATAQPPPSVYPRPGASETSPSTPEPSPPHGAPLTLTNNDSGRTITVAVGTEIHVQLQPELGNYDHPTTSDPAVVERHSVRGGYPGSDPSEGVFAAAAAGSADLSATTDAQCLHQQPRCMIPQKQWTVHIVVRR